VQWSILVLGFWNCVYTGDWSQPNYGPSASSLYGTEVRTGPTKSGVEVSILSLVRHSVRMASRVRL
jgi:hypothetical protein